MKKTSFHQRSGNVSLDPSKMDDRDLIEGAYMLQAAGTLLRQAFGIISLTNSLQDNPMSDSELKSFAQSFDIVHRTCNSFGEALRSFVNNRRKNDESNVSS